MTFGQLSHRENLRDLIVAMEAHSGKLYHLGIGKSVTRSNLSKANEQRDYHIFEEFAFFMIEQARKKRQTEIFKLGGEPFLPNDVYELTDTSFRLYFRSLSDDAHNIEVVFFDSFGREFTLTFAFSNEQGEGERK